MVRGKIYKFYGQFEHGDVVIGRFEGLDDPTGFLKFSNIVMQKNCSSHNRADIISRIAREMNGGDSTGCMSRFEDQAVAAYEDFAKEGVIPEGLIHHKESTYNIDKVSQITEMKNYFEEV